ncbi:MAG: cytochrome c family protein [Acidobacteriaceae bacterium]|jgi:formamidopyrimidine-DNA glycosylase|nr:cytochrome c family protein [Acidobacteriaceae bacterium]
MRFFRMIACVAVAALGVGCQWLDDRPAPVRSASFTAGGQSVSEVFSPERSSFGAATRDYFWVKGTPHQPIEFPHNIHIEKGLACTEACHESVTRGPQAGLPNVNTCLTCHAVIATDKPRIQEITQMQEKGLDLAWQRVYKFTDMAHVRFNHEPHIRNNVECSTCHGDIAHQTVAQRNVDLNMGFCVTCHREKNVSNDCLTCHY